MAVKHLSFLCLSSLIIALCRANCIIQEFTTDPLVKADEKKLLKIIEPLKGAEFEGSDGTYDYKLRICDTVNGAVAGAGAVQYQNKEQKAVLGMIGKADIFGGGGWIVLSYGNGSNYGKSCNKTERKAQIMILCDPKQKDKGELTVLNEKKRAANASVCFYLFELKTKIICPSDPEDEGLSSGSIFCILFFTFFGLYFILGFLYKRIVVGAQGLEQIPNYTFWREFGNLQADACDFVCRCGSRQESQAYRDIDNRLKEERDEQLLN